MSRGLADLIDVERVQALLDARGPLERRCLLADEVGHELHHARCGEQQVRVLERQRCAGHDRVIVGFEMVEEPFADFCRSHCLIFFSVLFMLTLLCSSVFCSAMALWMLVATSRSASANLSRFVVMFWVRLFGVSLVVVLDNLRMISVLRVILSVS